MKILTLGSSFTSGAESSDPKTKSWPAQMGSKYNVDVVNLAQPGGCNERALRIGIEELCRCNDYDWVIWAMGPAVRTEVLIKGKWQQVWFNSDTNSINRLFAENWHPWNDIQITMLLAIKFQAFVEMMGPKLLVTGLGLGNKNPYTQCLSWITGYQGDNDFRSLGMPLDDLNIGISDLDRKLKSLAAIHRLMIEKQPLYLTDIEHLYLRTSQVRDRYGDDIWCPGGHHPNDTGYLALADYFGSKIGLEI